MRGVVNGQVVSVSDPDNQGRVQVSLPFMGGQNESYWAPVATLMSGGGRGSWFMPEVGDEVLVAFNQDDVAHPFIIGFLWNGKDNPPETDPKNRVILTPGGHTIRFEDGVQSPKVVIRSKKQSAITFTDGPGPTKIEISSSGGLTIELDDAGKGSIKLLGGGRIFEMSDDMVRIS
ncbi:MAG: hypothetical protein C5B50_17445 [Verrucomicrobia bacterium]|nr:MAG: hypothetical protein C5B50_17445 [Verrucomicrobiota bacterium]